MRPIQSIYKQIGEDKSMLYVWFNIMNTRADIVLCNRDEKELKAIAGLIYDKLNELERIASFYDSSSELSLINRTASQQSVEVGIPLFTLIWQCIDYNKKTLGCFDITVKSDNFDKETISSIELDMDKTTVFFHREGIRIDLSGYLKGYALEAVKRIVEDFHISDALINLGNSSVLAMGNHPHGEGWKVEVAFPVDGGGKEVLLLNNCLTTSGNDKAERKHIISPHTGGYVEGIRGVSVITEKSTEGEALSTALLVASPEQRSGILKNFDAIVYDL